MFTAELQARGRMALALDGWDELSVWGYDEREASMFAQLWRNDDDEDAEPRVWISTATGWPPIFSPGGLAEAIAVETGCGREAALLALADQAPDAVREHLRALAAVS